MEQLLDAIRRRLAPGIFIIDKDMRLLYSNREALDMFPGIGKAGGKGKSKKDPLPEAVRGLCKKLRKGAASEADNFALTTLGSGMPCALRAFHIGHHGGGGLEPTHIMVLAEGVVERRNVDFEKVKARFGLTARELEVVKLICRGRTNREIASEMGISEYTVKDHIKNVMRKMDVGSRSGIIASQGA